MKISRYRVKQILILLLILNLITILYSTITIIFFSWSGVTPYLFFQSAFTIAPFILTLIYFALTGYVVHGTEIDMFDYKKAKDIDLYCNENCFIKSIKWIPRCMLSFALIGAIFMQVNYGGVIPRNFGQNQHRLQSLFLRKTVNVSIDILNLGGIVGTLFFLGMAAWFNVICLWMLFYKKETNKDQEQLKANQ